MEAVKTESSKPILSLVATVLFMVGGFWGGDHFGDLCVLYMNLTGGTALGIRIACCVIGFAIGCFVGLWLDKNFNVKVKLEV